MSELSGLSTSMLLNILRVCTDSRVQRGRELEYVRVVREATEEALASVREAPEPQTPSGPQCRTMVSQRPCGNVHCVRPECNPQRGYRLGCEDDDGRPVRPDCATPNGSCGCGFG